MAKKLEYNTDYLFNYDVKESVNSVIDEVNGLKSDVNGLIDISGAQDLRYKIASAQNRRIDLVMIGDSNQHKDAYGFARAIDNNLSAKYGCYSTPIFIQGFSEQQGVTGVSGQLNWATDTTPTPLDGLFISSGSINTSKTVNAGVIIPQDNSKFNSSSNIRFWLGYGGYTSGSGSFTPKVRLEVSPFTTLVTGAAVSTNTGSNSLNVTSIDLPSGVRAGQVKGGFSVTNTVTAPFTFYFYRAEDLNKDSGVSCHTLYGVGGQSLWDMADKILSYSNSQLTAFFSEVRRLQLAKGYKPSLIVYINSGLNDRNEASIPSKGVYKWAVSGSSAENYGDNITAIINKVEDVFRLNGWDTSELLFLTIASHVVSNPDDSKLNSYRLELEKISSRRHNMVSVNLANLMTYEEASAAGWYINSTTETEHLTQAGYDAVTSLIFD